MSRNCLHFTETAVLLPCSKLLTLVPILSQISQIYTFQSYFLRVLYNITLPHTMSAGPRGLAVYGVSLRPLVCWDCGFESHREHRCLSVVIVFCCQVEVSATSWLLVLRSPTDCGANLSLIYKPQEWRGPAQLGAVTPKTGIPCPNHSTWFDCTKKTGEVYKSQISSLCKFLYLLLFPNC
jgi:hypothetical protein